MRFESTNRISWIEVRPWADHNNDYSAFELGAHVEIGHGTFSAANRDIHLFDLLSFVDRLDTFSSDQSKEPQLNGTYDTYIRIRAEHSRIALDFCIGDAHCGGVSSEPRLTGTFEISRNVLSDMSHFFRQLATATPNDRNV
jgi:hypothetical protein